MSSSVWSWVYEVIPQLRSSGQQRLAEQVMQLANWSVNAQVEMVQAAVPEIVAASKTLGIPWLAVFARHWELQCRTVYRGEGESVLPDAVRAFELAHRDEHRDCPQALCTAQDLVIAYANADGPGYVSERIDALKEAIERVEPRRECFQCLREEMAEAYLDSGRPEDALQLVDAAMNRVRSDRAALSEYFQLERPAILLVAGEPAEALADLDRAKRSVDSVGAGRSLTRWRVLRAAAEAQLGNYADVQSTLPSFDEIHPYAREHLTWARTTVALVRAGLVANDATLGLQLARLLETHERGGAHRRAIDLAALGTELAADRGVRNAADWGLRRMQVHAEKLRRPAAVRDRLEAAASLVSGVAPSPSPVAPKELGEYLVTNPQTPPEVAIDWIDGALHALPDDVNLTTTKVQAQAALGRTEDAIATLRSSIEKSGPDLPRAVMLAQLLLARGRDAEVEQLAAAIMPSDPITARWILAQFHAARGRWQECLEGCEGLVATVPDAKNARRLGAAAARETGQWELAVKRLNEVSESDAGQSNDHWSLIVAASVVRDWAKIREGAARLGMKVDGEGPIDARFGTCWVLPPNEPISGERYFALRTSPAIARIVSVTTPDRPQRAGDVVVIDPSPLEPPPGDVEAPKNWVPTFREVAVLEKSAVKAFVIAGPDPGDDEWTVFATAVRDRGWFIWVLSSPEYKIRLKSRRAVPGIYAAIAVPEAQDLTEVAKTLTDLTSGWKVPVAWPQLARTAGLGVTLHQELEAKYGLRD